jgi:hypothetical protein
MDRVDLLEPGWEHRSTDQRVGRVEIADAVKQIAREVQAGKLKPRNR